MFETFFCAMTLRTQQSRIRRQNGWKIYEDFGTWKQLEKEELFYNNSEFVYSFFFLDLILNPFLRKGKRALIEKHFYSALMEIKFRLKKYPLFPLSYIILFHKPGVKLIPSRKGVKQYFIPTILPKDKQKRIFCRLFAKGLISRYEHALPERLIAEILSILLGENTSRTLKILRDLHDGAQRDRVYMHFRWNSLKDDLMWERRRRDLLRKKYHAQFSRGSR